MRRLTRKEIKHIMKFTLLGLYHVHEQGLVYTDLKMENMLINFFPKEPSDGSKTVAKLGDLGQVIPPSQGRCQAVAYRSPEVYFGKPWSYPADIWSWGIVLCHLLEARAQFDELGMYDDAKMKGTLEEREEIIRRRMFEDFKLYDVPFYSDCQLPPRDPEWTDDDNWVVRLVKKGISEYDVTFLWNVLKADPNERPTIEQIFRHGYLHNDEGDEDNKSDES
ncbi:hypothetical protein B0A49_00623 [Cryomyces minteri]|uniref:Protein kinase domain-containing protein n=1 Tax=Cryomyces minteri TaxID=331657 RepID=A0A4U0XV97_9PEZI|nr:hypothetical protein B0A49_00623 [Cryomyces minteri]